MAVKIFNSIPKEIRYNPQSTMLSKFTDFLLNKAYYKVSEYLSENPAGN